MSAPTRLAISRPRQALVDLMRDLCFGMISGLAIRAGEPHLALATVRNEIKLDRELVEDQQRGEDFLLKTELVRLFAFFDRTPDATVQIEVRHGLPFRIITETRIAAKGQFAVD